MKRRIPTLIAAAALMCALAAGTGAVYIPDAVTYRNIDGRQTAVRVYTLRPEQDPGELCEARTFDHGGCRYEFSDIVKEEEKFEEEAVRTETVTVETRTGDLKEILDRLEPTILCDDGTWSGVLALDHSTIRTEAAGYRKDRYTVSDTRTYTGLAGNDSSGIPRTVRKNGRTLELSDIAWNVESTALAGDELVPATYTACATYTGTASSTAATGYVTTADYTGTVTSSGVSGVRYTVTYLAAEPDPGPDMPDAGTVLSALSAAFIFILLLLWLLFMRTNTTVYRETDGSGAYEKCGRLRLRARKPVLDLNRLRTVPDGMTAFRIEARTARRLFGRTVTVRRGGDGFRHTVGRAEGAYWFKLDVGAPSGADAGEGEPG